MSSTQRLCLNLTENSTLEQGPSRMSSLRLMAVILCPTYDLDKALEYAWVNGICDHTITVDWSTDDRHEITRLDASYYRGCL